MKKLNAILVGYGYWGPNLARNLHLSMDFNLIAVIDSDEVRRNLARSTYGVKVFGSVLDFDFEQQIDLAVIATRPSSHKDLAKFFFEKRINVLITKPCGASIHDAVTISSLAKKNQVRVFCDFTYTFSPILQFLKSDATARAIVQDMRHYTSYRTALGIIQSEVDVLADLAFHDIYILLQLKLSSPIKASCITTNALEKERLHSAFITLVWSDGFTAAIHVSWLSPKKTRIISLSSLTNAIVLEEMNRESPIQIMHFSPNTESYENLTNQEKYRKNVSFTMGRHETPQIEARESLEVEIEAIAEAILSGKKDLEFPDGDDAVEVWKIIEVLRYSNDLGGKIQYVK